MEIIEDRMVWGIIRRTLSCVDPRLVDHGERVAYIALELLRSAGVDLNVRKNAAVLVLCLLHDIGAYKTDEIDRMMEFESQTVWEHSIYGALYLKRLSPLSGGAEGVLYHHVGFKRLQEAGIEGKSLRLADIIHLADRVDSVWKNELDFRSYLEPRRDRFFSTETVDLCLSAENRIREGLSSGRYGEELQNVVCRMHFSAQERRRFLEMLALSIDFRSEFMVLHTITTVGASIALARLLEIPKDSYSDLYYGALLHDIGKVSTPVEILEKPGKLTSEEFEVMKKHVTETGKILDGYVNPKAYRIAVRHHEKLDGSGYPLGLKAEDLSLEERICAISDIVSALVRRRSYKEAYDKEKTKRVLQEMADQGKIGRRGVKAVIDHYDNFMETIGHTGEKIMETYASIRTDYQEMLAVAKAGQIPSLPERKPLDSLFTFD